MVAAVATGNTIVLKASEYSPRSYWAVGSMFKEAGLPEGRLNIIQTEPKDAAAVTAALIEHRTVKKITFTGSAAIGSIIASQAGKALKPCVMELGGKAPAIILEDADLQKAAVQCSIGSFLHVGKTVSSTQAQAEMK
jgi:acyl-CoA reductase-like NAD-dependent aldehyde dehydrogenase